MEVHVSVPRGVPVGTSLEDLRERVRCAVADYMAPEGIIVEPSEVDVLVFAYEPEEAGELVSALVWLHVYADPATLGQATVQERLRAIERSVTDPSIEGELANGQQAVKARLRPSPAEYE